MSLKYLLIDPFIEKFNGISQYCSYAKDILENNFDIDVIYIKNTDKDNPNDFCKQIKELIETKYSIDDIIIEAPEVKFSTILLDSKYTIHTRLHCPLFVAQKYDNRQIDINTFGKELFCINKSWKISFPSFALAYEINNFITNKNTDFFKNPCPNLIKYRCYKKYDIIIMSRNQILKGVEFINPILSKLPKNVSVLIIGINKNQIDLKNINCNVKFRDFITSDLRYKLISQSKVLLLLSKFENCSMTICEAISLRTKVICWNVGGNNEFNKEIVTCIKRFDINLMVQAIIYNIKFATKDFIYDEAVKAINNDFIFGINRIINSKSKSINTSHYNTSNKFNYIPINLLNQKRVIGISISNEHIEELWGPVVNRFGIDYLFICTRPLGFHSVFPEAKVKIDDNKYIQLDWEKEIDKLKDIIYTFKPNLILFHNGLHPRYQSQLRELKKLNIPILYSELGWLPQKNNIYFDEYGTNGKSLLSSYTFEEFCQCNFYDNKEHDRIYGDYNVIVTQLENDTNLICNSYRFKDNFSFINNILSRYKNERFVIKLHPLEKNINKYNIYKSDKCHVVQSCNIDELLSDAKSVIGINSTLLIYALKFDINVYIYGDGILSNKKLCIDCTKYDLDCLLEFKYCSQINKNIFINELLNYQINVKDIKNAPTSQLLRNKSISIFINSLQKSNY